MRVSAFTFVRNAERLDYPVVESIRSALPMVDEFVVNVGQSDDGTRTLISSIGDAKIRILDSVWNPNVRDGGYILSQQTNIALFNCTGDWAIYLQSDEAIREQDHARLRELMAAYRNDDRVEGMALRRLSFFGDYATVVDVHPFRLDLAVRVVKPHKFVLSRGDAAGFTVHPKYKERGRRIRVVDSGLDVLHYMDVRTPAAAAEFHTEKRKFWAGGEGLPALAPDPAHYYRSFPRRFLARYVGAHPQSFAARIRDHGFDYDEGSPLWRTTLTAAERKLWWRSALVDWFGISSGIPSRKIIASHRARGDDVLVRRRTA
jgi:glycosyltransferase involved in cell wall biosynthesis